MKPPQALLRLPAAVLALGRSLRTLSGWGSRARFLRLRFGLPGSDSAEPLPLSVRALDGRALWVRPGTSDAMVVVEDFVHGFAEPPPEVPGHGPLRIVELGSNIGAGLAGLAQRYPQASILGVEADPGNAALARRNIEPWAARCRLVQAAIWEEGGQVVVERDGGRETGFTVRPAEAGGVAVAGTVPALTLDELLADFHGEEPIDYLYMDIEGTHERLLKGEPAWAERVRVIKVSRHLETAYSEHDCARDLERLGFSARVIPLEPTGWTIGVRS